MTLIAPVKLPSSYKALWFAARETGAQKNDSVVVTTARGTEFGCVVDNPFEATKEQLSNLKGDLKPVLRVATEEDIARNEELLQKGKDAMPDYRRIVEEEGLEMNPVSVEYLFDGDKAMFYFESEDRVDFRELVRKLSSFFKVRVDMRQIGVRDEARLIGGLGHCGQELCCKRLGGEFCPVSIRMAKEQDLSLNPQKISGICGRLMCCLRYEYDAYKDFKSRAPKVGGAVETPDGKGKVVQLDVPREIVTVQVNDDKKIKVPLEDLSKSSEEAARPDTISEEAWERATRAEELAIFGEATYLTSQFTESSKLGEAKAVHREPSAKEEKRAKTAEKTGRSGGSRRGSRGAAKQEAEAAAAATPRKRRRSTKLSDDGTAVTEVAPKTPERKAEKPGRGSSAAGKQSTAAKQAAASKKKAAAQQASEQPKQQSSRRRRRGGGSKAAAEGAQAVQGAAGAAGAQGAAGAAEKPANRPGRKSSALRQRPEGAAQAGKAPANASEKKVSPAAEGAKANDGSAPSASRKRRRPRRRSGSGGGSGAGAQGNGTGKNSSEKSE